MKEKVAESMISIALSARKIKEESNMAFISDLKFGVKAVKALRECRESGAIGVKIVPIRRKAPLLNSCWGFTPEAMLTYPPGIKDKVEAAFLAFDEGTQHALGYGSEPGQLVERIRLWQQALKPRLSPREYSAAILPIIVWARRCAQKRLGLIAYAPIVYGVEIDGEWEETVQMILRAGAPPMPAL